MQLLFSEIIENSLSLSNACYLMNSPESGWRAHFITRQCFKILAQKNFQEKQGHKVRVAFSLAAWSVTISRTYLTKTDMKKSFSLKDPKHKPERILEQIKADVRKYLKRERRKPLPEEVDFWDFKCRTGKSSELAEQTHVSKITEKIDEAGIEKWEAIYIEILAVPGLRLKKEIPESDHSAGEN